MIDIFAQNLNRFLSKEFLDNKSINWIDIFSETIKHNNNTPHISLDNIMRNQAISDPQKRMYVMHLKILTAKENGSIADLKPGDKVRMDDTALFKKDTKSRWSDEVHVVQSASGKSLALIDGKTHRRNMILMVPKNTVISRTTE